MLDEMQYDLFIKMKGSSAQGIDGFIVNCLRKFWSSLKLVTLNAINECYRDGSLTTNLKTSNIYLLRKGQKDPNLTRTTYFTSLNPLQACLMLHYIEASGCGW